VAVAMLNLNKSSNMQQEWCAVMSYYMSTNQNVVQVSLTMSEIVAFIFYYSSPSDSDLLE